MTKSFAILNAARAMTDVLQDSSMATRTPPVVTAVEIHNCKKINASFQRSITQVASPLSLSAKERFVRDNATD